MGIRDVFNSTTDLVKQNAPDLTPIKNACRSTYDLGCTAASKIDKTVRVDATQKLKEKLPDSEGQEKIGRILKIIGIHAVTYTVKETFKTVTGGIHFYNIIREGLKDEPTSRSLPHEIKKSEQLAKEMREMQTKMQKMDEEMKMLGESVKGKELSPPNAGCSDSTVLRKPDSSTSCVWFGWRACSWCCMLKTEAGERLLKLKLAELAVWFFCLVTCWLQVLAGCLTVQA